MYDKHVWILDVINDLREYVIKHDLKHLEAKLEQVREAARQELWISAVSNTEVMALCNKMFLEFHSKTPDI